MMTPWKKKILLKRLEDSFGKEPDKDYFPGDMEFIRTFYDSCCVNEQNQFHVDETTWKDLNMEDIYKRVNACQCTAGEQYLYYMLRTPMSQANYLKQHGLIHVTGISLMCHRLIKVFIFSGFFIVYTSF